MGVISWIIFGLIAGAVAKLLMPGKDPGGWIITILLGVGGALLGGSIGKMIGFHSKIGWGIGYFLTAVAGSLLLLGAYRLFLNRKSG